MLTAPLNKHHLMPPIFFKLFTLHPTKVNYCTTMSYLYLLYHALRRNNMLEEAHTFTVVLIGPNSPLPLSPCYIQWRQRKSAAFCQQNPSVAAALCYMCILQPLGSSPLAIDAVLFSGGRFYSVII